MANAQMTQNAVAPDCLAAVHKSIESQLNAHWT
jgi:hypothetical protein